ncbi:hypothetical protein [Achromobacter spanius]|uniref:Uncharacterized protein n=1 Tax=Achromobacter spanius TaxID=217203 RepID=A0AA42S6Z4_9BURK|nr:hypothetical protein [Achromobacter spanius]MDH0740197.1 hypothetical protein [Achromobacter spanius]
MRDDTPAQSDFGQAGEGSTWRPRRWSLEEFGAAFAPKFFLYELAHGKSGHIPGDTTTPPAPGAVWIGTGDA